MERSHFKSQKKFFLVTIIRRKNFFWKFSKKKKKKVPSIIADEFIFLIKDIFCKFESI